MDGLRIISKSRKFKSNGGYSLVEVMTSAFVLAVVVLLFVGISHSMASFGREKNRSTAINLAKEISEQIALTGNPEITLQDLRNEIDDTHQSCLVGYNTSTTFSLTRNQVNFNVEIAPRWVNSSGVELLSPNTSDLVKATITISWQSSDGVNSQVVSKKFLRRRNI